MGGAHGLSEPWKPMIRDLFAFSLPLGPMSISAVTILSGQTLLLSLRSKHEPTTSLPSVPFNVMWTRWGNFCRPRCVPGVDTKETNKIRNPQPIVVFEVQKKKKVCGFVCDGGGEACSEHPLC